MPRQLIGISGKPLVDDNVTDERTRIGSNPATRSSDTTVFPSNLLWSPQLLTGAPCSHQRTWAEKMGEAQRTLLLSPSKPQTQRSLKTAHCVRCQRQSKLRAVHRRIPTSKYRMIQQVSRRHFGVKKKAPAGSKSSGKGTIKAYLAGTRNRVSTCGSPLAD
jgi:hypothetical protein